MRIAHNDVSLVSGYLSARAEAEAAFGDSSVYIEKFIDQPRHIEIQVIADSKGNIVHLGERDCSLQRRHQKVVEEAPSPAISPEMREKMGEAAKRLFTRTDYVNAGTVEFLLDQEENFYFMELNARVQVEHPVTEMVSGVDIVQQQIRVAAGEELGFSQEDIQIRGHSIECRINAEDPDDDFRPSPGQIQAYFAPGGAHVRLDSHVYAGYEIPPHYDSMIAKLVVWGETREQALNRMRVALDEYVIEGVKTTIPLQRRILRNPKFIEGEFNTSFLEKYLRS